MSFEPVVLGRTGFKVGRLGLASSYGVPADAVEEAVDRGINYLFWGSIRRPGMSEGIKRVVKKDRNKIFLCLQTYHRWIGFARRSIEKGLRILGLDYADVLLLGFYNKRPSQRLLDLALSLKEQGKIRFIGLSTHRRRLIPELAQDKTFDLFHIRYNAAHRGAETDIFPYLPSENGPGIISFTATSWRQLLNPKKIPSGEKIPTAMDCYRFVLSHPAVHCCIAAPKNLQEAREDLKALELGPMTPEELAWMRRVGDGVYGK